MLCERRRRGVEKVDEGAQQVSLLEHQRTRFWGSSSSPGKGRKARAGGVG